MAFVPSAVEESVAIVTASLVWGIASVVMVESVAKSMKVEPSCAVFVGVVCFVEVSYLRTRDLTLRQST